MALLRMALRDFVIVQALDLDLNTGFSALTGETGAGKSILIDAVQFVLGARADTGTIREGAARCEVAAEFDCPATAQGWLQEAGLDTDGPLLLRRTLDAQGKSRAWINGSAVTATQLRELGEFLLDIHGQHAWQSLTRAQQVRELLDAYARIDSSPLQSAWQQWRQAQQALEQAKSAQDKLQSEQERLNWQIAEVQKLAPGTEEWTELNSQHSRLSHAQALLDAAQQAAQQLDDDEISASSLLQRATTQLQDMTHIEPEFAQWAQTLESAYAQIDDVARSLHTYLRKTDLDPSQLAQLDERMGLWMSLARRFKRPPEELAQTLRGWQQELAELEAAADLDALNQAEQQAKAAWLEIAKHISAQRKKAAPQLAGKVTAAMQQLGMQGGRFEIDLVKLDIPASHGLEDVVFLVAGHAGSTPKPVGKVASGGELSRIALAIAVTTSKLGSAGTLIFDEVDSGVGGAVAQTVGQLMQQLGRHRQVLAVTHLPQVAACANHHLRVSKHSDAKETQSTVTPLSRDERVQEIARMLGGSQSTATSLAHAREMLSHAQGITA
jgi:DNA repair protein RecN (Recombination protein N)